MHIMLVAIGTRGDVQPIIALGKGLQASGHTVSVVAGSNFGAWIGSHGLDFVPFLDTEALMKSEKGVYLLILRSGMEVTENKRVSQPILQRDKHLSGG